MRSKIENGTERLLGRPELKVKWVYSLLKERASFHCTLLVRDVHPGQHFKCDKK